jgi:hypothetical protein
MKRDVDLIRQLLFDIERHGADCPCDVLRNGVATEADERIRYHLRLLVDAGLAKEIDRTAAGAPCVRLTNAGHEFLDLCRGDERWREAKWLVQEQTGGLSLTVLRAVLTKWAVDTISRGERHRRWRRVYRPPFYRDYYYRDEPGYRVDSYRYGREPVFDGEPVRLVRTRAAYRDRVDIGDEWAYGQEGRIDEPVTDDTLGVSLPVNMI